MTAEEWLGNENQLGLTIWQNKYRHGSESFDQWLDRVSAGNAEVKRLIIEKKFLFGGRILANRGLGKGSLANCATLGRVSDSIKGIMEVATKLALTFKAEQGQGLSLTDIRPKGALIGHTYESDGIIPFMEVFNTVTQAIMQGGKRRGALLMALSAWHKEAPEFITLKSDLNKINNANLSLEIDDKFMNIVYNDYMKDTETVVHMKKDYDGGSIEYDVCPIKLFKLFCRYAWKTAEPGILYTDRLFNYNLMQYDKDYTIYSTNACSEQPLIPNGLCMLSSFNLSEYVRMPFTKDAEFDSALLSKDIRAVVRAMDDIVDENLPLNPLKEQSDMARKYRNIGIGIMGMHDVLIKMGITYGSKEAVDWARAFMKWMFNETLQADVELAAERGSFPGYTVKVWDSDIIQHNVQSYMISEYRNKNMLRNCSLLSVAPTGSIGTMLGVSTGCEPYYALSYNRRTVSMGEATYKVEVPIVNDYRNTTGNNGQLPEYFVTAYDINWEDRINMQAALQEACDTAISSTCNIPKETSVEDVEKMYMYAWTMGCKGFTCYRDGSREGVLTLDKPKEMPVTRAPKRPKELDADLHVVQSKGKQYIVIIGLFDGKPYEVFAFEPNITLKNSVCKGKLIKKSKMHYSFESDMINITELELANDNVEEKAATLYTSMLLRHGVPIKYVVKTAKKVNDNITSFSSAMCRVLSKYIPNEDSSEKCPKCGGKVINEGGCMHCESCEWSKCE